VPTIVMLGVALGLDSMRASVALGMQPLAMRRRVRLALLFGLWDGAALLAGLVVGGYVEGALESGARIAAAAALGAYGVALAVGAHRTAVGRAATWVPAALSLDNLGAGVALGGLGAPAALAAALVGGISALMAGAGLCAASIFGARMPTHAARIGGLMLIGVAVIEVVGAG
jgi:manganese efflux pump family protein